MENGVEVQLKGLLREKARIEALLATDPNWQAYLRQVDSFRAHSETDAAGEITLTEDVMAALESNRLFQARCKLVDAISLLEELLARPGTYQPPPFQHPETQAPEHTASPAEADAAVAHDDAQPAAMHEPAQIDDEQEREEPETETEPQPDPVPQPGDDIGTDVSTLLPLLARAGAGSLLSPMSREPAVDIIEHAANDTEKVQSVVADTISPAAPLPDQAAAETALTEADTPISDDGPDDLTLIRGITLDDAIALEDAGVMAFAALATLTATDVKAIAETSGFGRRIAHEGWIEQAAMLVRRGRTRHADQLARIADVAIVQAPAEETWQRRPLPVPPAPPPEDVRSEPVDVATMVPTEPSIHHAAADGSGEDVTAAIPETVSEPDPADVVLERHPLHGPLQGPPAPPAEADDATLVAEAVEQSEHSAAADETGHKADVAAMVPVATNDDGPASPTDDDRDAPADEPAAQATAEPFIPPPEFVGAADNDTAHDTAHDIGHDIGHDTGHDDAEPLISSTSAPSERDEEPPPHRVISEESDTPAEVQQAPPAAPPTAPPAAPLFAQHANSNVTRDVPHNSETSETSVLPRADQPRERENLALNARIARLEQTISTIVMPDLKRPPPDLIEKGAFRAPPQRPAVRTEPAALEPPTARPQLPAPDVPPEPMEPTEPVASSEHDRLPEPPEPVEAPLPAVWHEAPVPLVPLPAEREKFPAVEEADVEIIARQPTTRPSLPPPPASDRADPLRLSAADDDAFDPTSHASAATGDETTLEALTRHARVGEEASVEIVQPRAADRKARSRDRIEPPPAGAAPPQRQAPAASPFRRLTQQPETPAAPPADDNARSQDAAAPTPVRPPVPQPAKRPPPRHQRFLTALTGEKEDGS